MKILYILLFIVLPLLCCSRQEDFDAFANRFEPLKIPLIDILNLPDTDTLNGKLTNDILIRSQKVKPQYIDKEGQVQVVKEYYGLYPEKPFAYGYRGKQLLFITKVIPIGRLNLNPNYLSFLIKVVDYDTTFYDLWNFSKDGEVLSVVCLFWGMRDGGPHDEKVTFTIVSSEITEDGIIDWNENNDGLKTSRTYQLNNDGYFQIMSEKREGSAEY